MTGEPPSAAPSSAAATSANPAKPASHGGASMRFWPLAVGAIGVVFGDIGTSPLYAFRLALQAASSDGVHADAVYGVVSLALWALFLVVTVKYVLFLMRADNKGEGGVLALMALAQSAIGRRTTLVFILGVAGAALFYGDSIITPAISVLSAVEGLKTVPALQNSVSQSVEIIVSLAILGGLFYAQSRGTAKVARFFGPILVFWFFCIAATGLSHLVHQPAIFLAISPAYAIGFLLSHGIVSFFVLGSVFLTVTGAEALYADMGHFGRWPIQAAWLFLCLPCLIINYLGQGAFALEVLHHAHGRPVGDVDWFFQMTPEVVRAPMVLLATAATVIASQAVITGAYSMTQQAMQLGLLPRMIVRRTSETAAGQIYLPQINMFLAVGVVLLIAVFKTSDNLGQAYGLAVTGTMVVTTSLAFIVVRRLWKWPLVGALALIGPLWALDVTFLAANSLKILSGAAMPLVLGGALFLVMATWVRGGDLLTAKMRRDTPAARGLPRHAAGQAAAQGAGHGGLSHRRPRPRARRAVAQSQAQQGPASAERHPDRRDHRQPARGRARARVLRADQRRLQAGRGQVWLHGDTEHPQGARRLPPTGPGVRRALDLVLPGAQDGGGQPAQGPRPLAGPALHPLGQELRQPHRLLPDPARAGAGDGHPGQRIERAGAG